MRQLASFLLIALALPVAATEVWRWKDANGVMHYGDQPVPGAERVNVGPAPATANPGVPQTTPPPRAPEPAAEFRYASCTVATPANDEVFFAVNTVTASVQLSPGLQVSHRMQVNYDGQLYPGWPSDELTHTLVNVNRGTHTLSVQVVDAGGKPLCAGPVVTFHVRQPSVLSPARRPAQNTKKP